MAEGIMMDLVVGVRAEGIKVDVEGLANLGTGLGSEEAVAELGAAVGFAVSFNRLIYKNNSKILVRKLI
jgi:hypothetical protein